jgi:omega-hydroxy-beta-dihydromenaquinone-9 sulfotransferase
MSRAIRVVMVVASRFASPRQRHEVRVDDGNRPVPQGSLSIYVEANKYPSWSPRFWHGMRAGTWWRLLGRNRFRVAPPRLHVALGVSVFSPINDLLAAAQWLIFERQIAQTEIKEDPVFILGHWRSGTTLLHELLVTDPHFASPNTFQCFAPAHFLLSEYLMVRFGNFLLPKKRPMDEMAAGWQLPQEDEFALMNLGVPTPYLRIAFPQTQPAALEYLDMQGLTQSEREIWRRKFLWFVKALTYHYGNQRLVLKSPPHTGRIKELLELFPRATFIHLSRDPCKLYPSTLRLWRALDEVQGLQPTPEDAVLEAYVAECLKRMYRGYEAGRGLIPEHQFAQVRYEDLVAEPAKTVESLYRDLNLGDFTAVKPQLDKRLEGHRNYKTNRHEVDRELERRIYQIWPEYAAAFGYEPEPNELEPAGHRTGTQLPQERPDKCN